MDGLDLGILSIAAFAWLTAVGAAHHWPGADVLHRLWRRVEPYLGAYVRRSPATFSYAGVIFVTTWVVAGLNGSQQDALLRTQSTNLDNLGSHPVAVLFRSAFWSGTTLFLPFLALLAFVLAPAEVWLGTFRLILIFALGHVGATLITAVAIGQGFFSSPVHSGIAHTVDVGISYGTFCVAGVLTYRLQRPWRVAYAVALLIVFGLFAFVVSRTFTDLGHFVSVLIGLASYPFVRATSVAERARSPLYRPWLRPAAALPVTDGAPRALAPRKEAR